MGQRIQNKVRRAWASRLTLEMLEDRRVLTGLLGALAQPPVSLPAAPIPALTNAPVLSSAVAEANSTLATLPNAATEVAVSMQTNIAINVTLTADVAVTAAIEPAGADILPAVTLSTNVALDSTSAGLLPGLSLDLGAVVSPPAGASPLADLNLEINAAIEPAANELLPEVSLGVEVNLDSSGTSLLPDLTVDVTANLSPAGNSVPPIGGLILVPPIGPGIGADIGLKIGVGIDATGGGLIPGKGDVGDAVRGPQSGLGATATEGPSANPPGLLAYFAIGAGTEETPSATRNDGTGEEEALTPGSQILPELGDVGELDSNVKSEEQWSGSGGWLSYSPDETVEPGGLAWGTSAVHPVVFEMAGLLDGTGLDAAGLEQALQELLGSLQELAQWCAASGLYPWLMAVLAAAVACEVARRSLRRIPGQTGLNGLLTGLVTVSE